MALPWAFSPGLPRLVSHRRACRTGVWVWISEKELYAFIERSRNEPKWQRAAWPRFSRQFGQTAGCRPEAGQVNSSTIILRGVGSVLAAASLTPPLDRLFARSPSPPPPAPSRPKKTEGVCCKVSGGSGTEGADAIKRDPATRPGTGNDRRQAVVSGDYLQAMFQPSSAGRDWHGATAAVSVRRSCRVASGSRSCNNSQLPSTSPHPRVNDMAFAHALMQVLVALAMATTVWADENWVPFHLPWEAPPGAIADARFLLDPPAGKHGPISIRDGHFSFANGSRVRFWAVNLSGEGCLPPREIAPRAADRLAKFGFNLVRLHGLDSRWGNMLFPKKRPTPNTSTKGKLDKLDYFVAELEKRGIYVNLNLHVARHFMPGDGLPQTELLGYGKYCVLFDPRMIELQKDYARMLLTHRNPYTGHTYAADPAVVVVELTNEDSLFGGWTSGFLRGRQSKPNAGTWSDIPPYYGEELTRFYNQWLAKRFPTREALAAAWQGGARAPGAQLLQNGDFSAGTRGWELSRQKGASASLEVADDAPGGKPSAKITVTRSTAPRGTSC